MTKGVDNSKLQKTSSDYKNINTFASTYNDIDYIKFDYYIVNELSLFAIDPDLDFHYLEDIANKILKTMPAIMNIFKKPLLHLKEEDVIMPIEAVRVIDKNTIQHASIHSELWDNLKKDNIKPAKLLTKIYQDNYGIYENLIFCETVDRALNFTRQNIRLLKDLILTRQLIEMNLLERVNHLNHFLALGKLHTGYIRFFDKFYDIAQEDLDNLDFIYNQISSKLGRPVYKKNIKRPSRIRLQKTNILAMHKDYRQIYSLINYLGRKEIEIKENIDPIDISAFKNNYFNFCQILLLFAIGHFNYVFDARFKIIFSNLDVIANFKKWHLRVFAQKVGQLQIIKMEIMADKKVNIVLIPLIDNLDNREEAIQKTIALIKSKVSASLYIVCTPYEYDEYLENECFLSISNIESYRRIQQILLKAMILADVTREECPFCSNIISPINSSIEDKKIYACKSCRTAIVDAVCPKSDKPFTYTKILNLPSTTISKDDYKECDLWLYYRKLESQMFFRNTTKLDSSMNIICPHCNSTHEI